MPVTKLSLTVSSSVMKHGSYSLDIWIHWTIHSQAINTISTLNINNSWTSSRTKTFFIVVKSTKIQFECANIDSKRPPSLSIQNSGGQKYWCLIQPFSHHINTLNISISISEKKRPNAEIMRNKSSISNKMYFEMIPLFHQNSFVLCG